MSKKKRGPNSPKRVTERPPQFSAATPAKPSASLAALPEKIPNWRLWIFRLTLAIVPPCLLLGFIEVSLRIVGYGYRTSFFLKTEEGRTYTTNRKFGWQFYARETSTVPYPVFLPVEKPAGTLRVFILGESAAAGTPDPAFGFARILDVMLRRLYPNKKIEIVNAAMRGINSHIILPIARECARYQPDLFVIYMGNNEVIGLYAPEPKGITLTPYLRLLRLGQAMKSTRFAQLLESGIRALQNPESAKVRKQGVEYFRDHRLATDDPRRRAVYDNFRANLEDIFSTIQRAGAKAVVSSVAVNLRDFPPLGSLHRIDLSDSEKAQWEKAYAGGVDSEKSGRIEEAIQRYSEALRNDDHFAELHFRLGRCYSALEQFEKAAEHFKLARDWDAMQFRTDSRVNEIIRQIAVQKEKAGIYLVDAEKAFAESPLSNHKTPGEKLFNDHVHFTFDGDYLLAKTVLAGVSNALVLEPSTNPVPTKEECAGLLAFTAWDEFNVSEAMARMTANPPFTEQLEHSERQRRAELSITNRLKSFRREDLDRASQTYRQAIAAKTNEWQLHFNFGGLLSDLKDFPSAMAQYELALKIHPDLLQVRLALADILMKSGKSDEAIRQYGEALRLDPESATIKEAIALAEEQRRARR